MICILDLLFFPPKKTKENSSTPPPTKKGGDFSEKIDITGVFFKWVQAWHFAKQEATHVTSIHLRLSLGDFNEGALLHNVRCRYFNDSIYTGIGSCWTKIGRGVGNCESWTFLEGKQHAK